MSLAFCLCADDYAMAPGVTRGILEALDAGALSATSAMTTSPWWPEAAPALGPYVGRADIGLHLNLTQGAPLGPMPRFAPDGRLPTIGTILRLQRRHALPHDEIAAEITRQCERFAVVFGRPPDHVDGHQHVHALRAIRPLLFEELRRRAWTSWVRDSADRPWRFLRRGGRRKAAILAVVADGFAADARQADLARNDGFAGFSSFDISDNYGHLFASYLNAPGPRHLVMCHPGYVDDELRKLDPVLDSREQELRFLLTGLPSLLRARTSVLRQLSAMPQPASHRL